jgi:hypothetical protein
LMKKQPKTSNDRQRSLVKRAAFTIQGKRG